MAIEETLPQARSDENAPATAAVSGKSTAMWLMPIAAFIEVLITVDVMLSIGFIPPLVVFAVALLAIAVLGLAHARPWVFMTGGVCCWRSLR